MKTKRDVLLWFDELVRHENINLHPDTPFEDYTNKDGTYTYSETEVSRRNDKMDVVFALTNDDPYYLATLAFLPFPSGVHFTWTARPVFWRIDTESKRIRGHVRNDRVLTKSRAVIERMPVREYVQMAYDRKLILSPHKRKARKYSFTNTKSLI